MNKPKINTSQNQTQNELVRLSKRMSELGLSSRREADHFIEMGWVKVNGQVVDQLGSKVSAKDKIELDERARKSQESFYTILLNKPIGYVSNQPEDNYREAKELLTEENFDGPGPSPIAPLGLKGLEVAGRLDIDSQGLLIFTQDGRVAKIIIGENSNTEKEYLVRVDRAFSEDDLMDLEDGIELDGKRLKPCRIERINEDQYRFLLREGKKRQIRRMCEWAGVKAIGLKRVRIGRVRLGNLPEGKWRLLARDEMF